MHECSYCYLEADELARFFGIIAGERIKARGLSAMPKTRAEELHQQGLPNAAEWAIRLSADLAGIADADWTEWPTAEKRATHPLSTTKVPFSLCLLQMDEWRSATSFQWSERPQPGRLCRWRARAEIR